MDLYKILDIPRSATLKDIKKAFKKRSLEWHPDKNLNNLKEADKRFKEIAEAYRVLSNEDSRRLHDDILKNTSCTPSEYDFGATKFEEHIKLPTGPSFTDAPKTNETHDVSFIARRDRPIKCYKQERFETQITSWDDKPYSRSMKLIDETDESESDSS